MKDYSKMSDQDLNKAVADYQGVFWHISPSKSKSGGWEYSDNYEQCDTPKGMVAVELPDICNNPSDAWPIINRERIGVYPSEGPEFMPWIAAKNAISVTDKNPLRAAMIVYLMMKDEEK